MLCLYYKLQCINDKKFDFSNNAELFIIYFQLIEEYFPHKMAASIMVE